MNQYAQLNSRLNKYSSYQESYGDYYLENGQPRTALKHYLLGLDKSSRPDLLSKAAYSYQLLGNHDSSEYYYTIVKNMQPHKFIPQYNLLKLYQSKNDTLLSLTKAKEILQMPIKVYSSKVEEILEYAKTVDSTYKQNK